MADYRYLLWDIDGTILDFEKAEKAAIEGLFKKYGFGECTDEMLGRYSVINRGYWEALERNEISKPEVLVGRFRDFFSEMGLPVEKAEAFNKDYQLALGDTIAFCDNAYEILKRAKGKYILAAVTNGTKTAQVKKLSKSGLDEIFDYVFISEEIGVEKPNAGFFDKVFDDMKIVDKSKALIIGDSLTSDIKGGNNAEIDTCWYNPKGKKADGNVSIKYEIAKLDEIEKILA